MIKDGFQFIALLFFVSGIVIYLEKKFKNGKFFKYIPALVIIYFGSMILSTLGVWDMSVKSVSAARGVLKDAILPSMIFLMLLRADLRDCKVGSKNDNFIFHCDFNYYGWLYCCIFDFQRKISS